MLKLVLAALAVCALPSTVNAQEKPDVAEQLKQLAADRERLLKEAPEQDRVALLDAERVLGAQGEKGWEFKGALKTIRQHRHEAAVPILLLKLHELHGRTTGFVGSGILTTLGVLTGDTFPTRQTDGTFVELLNSWWRPNRDTLTVDVTKLDPARRGEVLRSLLDLSKGERASTGPKGNDPAATERNLDLLKEKNERALSSEEIPSGLVPDLVELLVSPADRWEALRLLKARLEQGQLPQLAELRTDERKAVRLGAELLAWVNGESDPSPFVRLLDDSGAPHEVRAVALVALGKAAGAAGDARILAYLEGKDAALLSAAYRAAAERQLTDFVAPIAERLLKDPAGPDSHEAYHALGQIRGVEAETCLVQCIEALLVKFSDDGPSGVFSAAGGALDSAVGRRSGSHRRRAELEAVLKRWREANPERSLEEWLSDLSASDPRARAGAVRGLARRGPSVVPTVETALSDKNAMTRLGAARVCQALGAGAVEAAPALVAALADSESVGRAASEALRAIGPKALPALEDGLKHASNQVRRLVTELLVALGPQAKKGLERALKDRDEWVRKRSAEGLAACGDDARKLLEGALSDTSELVRSMAASGLGKLPLGPSLSKLKKALGDPSVQVQLQVAKVLAAHGEEGVKPLVKFLGKQPEPNTFHHDRELRSILDAAGAIAFPQLSKIASRSRSQAMRQWAADKLVMTGEAKALPTLLTLLKRDRSPQVRKVAVAELSSLLPVVAKGGADMDPIRAALKHAADRDKSEDVRKLSAQLLEELDK